MHFGLDGGKNSFSHHIPLEAQSTFYSPIRKLRILLPLIKQSLSPKTNSFLVPLVVRSRPRYKNFDSLLYSQVTKFVLFMGV